VQYRPPNWWADLRPYMGWLISLFGSLLIIIGLLLNGIRLRHRSEAALRLSAQNYLALFNSSTDAILVRDAVSHAIVEVNPRFCSLYGYSAAEALTLSAAQISAEESPHTGAGTVRLHKAQTEGPQFFEWRSRRKDGSLFWSEVSLTAFDLPEGRRLISTVRDISDRKQLQTQAQAFHHQVTQIYQNLPVAVFVIDAAHRVTFWNEQMSRLTGVASADIIGSTQTWRGIYPAARPCLVDVVVDGLPASELERLYGDSVRASAEVAGALEGEACFPPLGQRPEVWLRFCAAPLFDEGGRVVGAIETMFDVSALKNSQHSLLELNQQLETRVEARSRELKLAMDQLLQSEKLAALGSLVAGVAHELNTPIGNVLAAASTLNEVAVSFGKELLSGTARRSTVQAKTEQLRQAGELIERNAARAAKLISDFKQAAVDQTSSRRREFDLLKLVTDTLAMLAPGLRHHRHLIQLDIEPGIWLDSYPGPLEMIIGNLLDNSLRHGFAGRSRGLVSIQARADLSHVQLRFSDDGCGIEVAALSHVFEPFYTSRLGQGGSGLGLYIVYNLVTSILQGSIEVSNQSPAGCCFEIKIPRRGGIATARSATP
jgi:PAS domain S-box-containing protein